MERMTFASKQPLVKVTPLPNGMTDVRVLTNEQEVTVIEPETGAEQVEIQYDGNQFRSVYDITASDVEAREEHYLNYSAEDEPTMEQLQHDNQLIDDYTMELMEGGLL